MSIHLGSAAAVYARHLARLSGSFTTVVDGVEVENREREGPVGAAQEGAAGNDVRRELRLEWMKTEREPSSFPPLGPGGW